MIDRIEAIDEAKAATLCISFRETGKYFYYDVSPELFDDFRPPALRRADFSMNV